MKDAKKVHEIIKRMVDASKGGADNRALLNAAFNGDPPMTAEDAERNHRHTNINFLEGTEKIHEARTQVANALKATDQYYTVKLDTGSVHQRRRWSSVITKQIKRITKRSRNYSDTIDASVAQMILHGPGPSTWMDRDDWCPKARAIGDMLIPQDTLTSLQNLRHFGVKIALTVSDLCKTINGAHVDKGWDVAMIKRAIGQLKKIEPGNQNVNQYDDPEKVIEDWKQNGAYYTSDASPVLHCFDFYYFEPSMTKDKKSCWRRQVIVDTVSCGFEEGDYADKFLYNNPDISYGKDVERILHAQIADGAVVAPFKWHSVRSLGYMIYPLFMLQNLMRSHFNDAVFESMLWLFKDVTDGDREVIQKVDIRHQGVIPNGLKWVLQNERHTINYDLVSGAMAMNQRLMSESSAAYTQNVNESSREVTATEVMARVNSANRLLTSILTRVYDDQVPQYREITRRLYTTDHEDCIEFRRRCMAEGVDPAVFKEPEASEIIPERSMGGGNKTLQIAQAKEIMSVADRMNPRAQNTALHIFIEAVSGDPAVANELAPLEEADPSPAAEKATLAWGTLIDGKPVIIAGDVNRIEFIETLLKLVDIEFKRINLGNGGLPPMQRVEGLANVVQVLKGLVEQISGDDGNAQRVRGYSDAIGKAENYIKGYVQQHEQQQEAQGQEGDPEAAAAIQAKLIGAQSDAKIREASAEQKMRHKEVGFVEGERRKDVKTANELVAAGARTAVELESQRARAAVQLEGQE